MVRRHWPVVLVLAAGAVLRVACAIAYRPALFYSDSWGYLSMAHGGGIVSFAPLRPSGYPLLLKLLHSLVVITTVQHIAGLVTALLVYATARALGVRRWLAAAGAALIALDAWAIALEQYVLAEAFTSLALALAVWLSLAATMRTEMVSGEWSRPDRVGDRTMHLPWQAAIGLRPRPSAAIALGLAGLCIAAAGLMRPSALFAVPAWVVWMLWVRPGLRPVLAGLACLLVPLVIYSAAHAHTTGTFGLTQANGWFLYGRVGPIASCGGIDVAHGARKLCARPPQAAHENQSFFMFNRRSPARRAFGGISADSNEQARSNRVLGHFARQVILHRPGAYAKLVATDLLDFFRPGPHALHREDDTVAFPHTARIRFDDRSTRRRLYPHLRTHAGAPKDALRSYASVMHTSRPLIALITLASLLALAIGARRGIRAPRPPAARSADPRVSALFLALGIAVGILLGAALAAGFALRYLVPVVAEFAIAATLSAELLTSAARGWRVRRASPLSPREADGVST